MFQDIDAKHFSSGAGPLQELGSLGMSNSEFNDMLDILKSRVRSIEEQNNSVGSIFDKVSQVSLVSLLATKSTSGDGGSAATAPGGSVGSFFTPGGGGNSGRVKLLSKLVAEEVALKKVYDILRETKLSDDNPLSWEDVPRWPQEFRSDLSDKNRELLFREGVYLDVTKVGVRRGRSDLKNEFGLNPMLLSININIRIVQCLMLDFTWFANRLLRLTCDLQLETTAVSTIVVSDNDSISNMYPAMEVKHIVPSGSVGMALNFLSKEYSHVADLVEEKPSCFVVDFVIHDSVIGLAETPEEHLGSACMEWRCFNSIRKNAGDSGVSIINTDANSGLFGTGANSGLFGTGATAPIAEAAIPPSQLFSAPPNDEDCGLVLGSSLALSPVSVSDGGSVEPIDWIKRLAQGAHKLEMSNSADGVPSLNERPKFQRFKAGTGTASLAHNATVNLAVMPKGCETKPLFIEMVKYIDNSARDTIQPHMCMQDDVFPADINNKDLYRSAAASNPCNLYRVVTCLFVNVALPKLRNPLLKTVYEVSSNSNSHDGKRRRKVVTFFGSSEIHHGTTKYASGKIKHDSKRQCFCLRACEEVRCFDLVRAQARGGTGGSGGGNEPPANSWHRKHSIHRCSSHEFRIYDSLITQAKERALKNGQDASAIPKTSLEMNKLVMDTTAFDNTDRCFNSAGIHHLFCTDFLMVHRGQSFNIDLNNEKLETFKETAATEEYLMSQKVDPQEAIETMRQSNLRDAQDVIRFIKENNMSLREYSAMPSRTIEAFNRETDKFCRTNIPSDMKQQLGLVMGYLRSVLPLLKNMLTFVDNAPLGEAISVWNASPCPRTCNNLLGKIVEFATKNYNASVASAINRKGYLSFSARLTGYKYNRSGTPVDYHETLARFTASVAYADYHSPRYSDEDQKIGGESVDEAIDSLMGAIAPSGNDCGIDILTNAFVGATAGSSPTPSSKRPGSAVEGEPKEKSLESTLKCFKGEGAANTDSDEPLALSPLAEEDATDNLYSSPQENQGEPDDQSAGEI
uniref:Wsv285-like protein n=1 Tax=Sicyonia whispovirus TaxID=2984283 RepID=A0A9C7BNP7_9VIRU|nr:MAG: wsv285-like protein [Sicyonia whispovirus]